MKRFFQKVFWLVGSSNLASHGGEQVLNLFKKRKKQHMER